MSTAEDIRKSLMAAMIARAVNTDLYVHMLNGKKITLSPNAFPLSLEEEDSIMEIGDDTNGRFIMLNLNHVSFVECSIPKKGETSNMLNVMKNISKVMDVEYENRGDDE